MTRISYDYLGVLDFTKCDVTFEVLRPGRAIDLVEGILSQHGCPVLRARVWLLSTRDTSAVEGGAREPLPPPEDGRAFDLTRVWPGDYIKYDAPHSHTADQDPSLAFNRGMLGTITRQE